jgi:hypothetical protein
LALSSAAVIAGLIVALTVGSLLGGILIIGGVAGLGWGMVPGLIEQFVHFLSTGSFRRPYK